MPRYSVVIPTYNRSELVRAAVESVLEGGFDDVEVVVVDDGSTDGTAEVLAELCEDDRVRALTVPNMGACVARNVGIALASGEWVGFLDSDDTWEPGFLAAVDAEVESVPGTVVALYTSGRAIDDETGAEVFHTEAAPVARPERELLVQNFVAYGAVVARRDVLQRVGGWDPAFRSRQDLDLYLRLARSGSMRPVPDAWRRVRVGAAGRISTDASARLGGVVSYYEKHRGQMTLMERSRVAAQVTARAREAGSWPTAIRFAPIGLAHVLAGGLAGFRRRRARQQRPR